MMSPPEGLAASARQALLPGAPAQRMAASRDQQLLERVTERFGTRLDGHCFGVWGPAIDAGAVQSRSMPSMRMLDALLQRGAVVRAFDPMVMPGVAAAAEGRTGLVWVDSPLAVAECGSALLLLEGCASLHASDLAALRGLKVHPVLFDMHRQCDASLSAAMGFVHVGIGRPVIDEPAALPAPRPTWLA
jgi:UDPglucose 6-dehydrogenase